MYAIAFERKASEEWKHLIGSYLWVKQSCVTFKLWAKNNCWIELLKMELFDHLSVWFLGLMAYQPLYVI